MGKWKTLSLTASEEIELNVNEGDQARLFSPEEISLCLVAKVITNKKVNPDTFKSFMKSIWKAHEQTRIELAGDNVFVVQFRSCMEKACIISDGPWTFDHSLVVLKFPKASENISNLSYDEAPFWIQVHNVPFNCMNSAMARSMRDMIGTVEEIENNGSNDWTGPFIRIWVVLNILKPLRRGLKVKASDGTSVWCPILYEKLPDICFGCGLIGHFHRECMDKETTHLGNISHEYGDWMRATILKRNDYYSWDQGRDLNPVAEKINL